MPKYRVAVARPTANGWHRAEVGNLLIEMTVAALYSADGTPTNPEVGPYIEDIDHIPAQYYPASINRNRIVETAKVAKADMLLMIDADAGPASGTFEALFTFLRQQPVPSVVACPTTTTDGSVLVFQYVSDQLFGPLDRWKSVRMPRELAGLQEGFQRCARIGTHVMMFDMRVLEKLKQPYFRYCANTEQTEVTETEDCYFVRKCEEAGVPVFCAWGFKAVHYKECPLTIQPPLAPGAVPDHYERLARAKLLKELQDAGALPHVLELLSRTKQEEPHNGRLIFAEPRAPLEEIREKFAEAQNRPCDHDWSVLQDGDVETGAVQVVRCKLCGLERRSNLVSLTPGGQKVERGEG